MKERVAGPERDPETGSQATEVPEGIKLQSLPCQLFPPFVFLVPGAKKPMGKWERMQIPALENDPGALTEDGLLPALPPTPLGPYTPPWGSHQQGPDPGSSCKFCPALRLTTLGRRMTTETLASLAENWMQFPAWRSPPPLSPSHHASLTKHYSP